MGRHIGLPLLFLFLAACSGDRSSAEISVARPASLQALNIVTHVYAVTSVEPERHQELVYDSETDSFKGTVEVPTGSAFDLTVVYEGDETSKGQRVELQYLTRRGLLATGPQMTVAYEENSWEPKYEGNATLDLDGDGFGNYAELLYGSDLYSKASIPTQGPKASASQEDPVSHQDVPVPSSASIPFTSAYTGTAEFDVITVAPGDIKEMTIVSPTYGFKILTPTSETLKTKKMRVSVETDRFVVGNQVGTIPFTVRVKDRYGLSRDTPLVIAAFNNEDKKPPSLIRLTLSPNQLLAGAPTFVWELDDPSGIDASSVSVAYNGFPVQATVNDEDPSPNRLLANITLPITVPDGNYTILFHARDLKRNLYEEAVPVTVKRSTDLNQKPLVRSVSVSSSSPRIGEPYTISWVGDDPDGFLDIAGYQVEVTDSTNDQSVISCANFNGLNLRRGVDYSQFCTLKRVGYGESVSFFELAPLTDYTLVVTVRDSLGGTGSGSVSFTTVESTLVGWWRMEEGSGELARDASGNGANGRLNSFSMSTAWADGIFGKGLLFDGVNDLVSIDDRADWDFQGTDFTISVWVKVASEATTGSPFISHNAGASANLKWSFLRSGSTQQPAGMVANRLVFYTCYEVSNGTCKEFWVQEGSDWTITLNRWYHLVVTRKGTLYSLYRDGVLVGAAESDVVLPRVEGVPLVLGASETDFRLNGVLDEVSMHKKALSEDEIRQSCRREMPSIPSGGGSCPDTKQPIILT
ncbi:MAG: LamG domain-containing protein, partial [Deltaproteobacteria bacterium]|nr:LamG domain-containing protein [Deltaproteobacteria bacterium]